MRIWRPSDRSCIKELQRIGYRCYFIEETKDNYNFIYSIYPDPAAHDGISVEYESWETVLGNSQREVFSGIYSAAEKRVFDAERLSVWWEHCLLYSLRHVSAMEEAVENQNNRHYGIVFFLVD